MREREWSLCSKVSKSIKINSDFILFEKKEKKKAKFCVQTKIHEFVWSENLNGNLRNEEIALMAIRVRILFTLGLLLLNGSILSGEQIRASKANFIII